ncbi:alanine racemase [Larsenimonas suaedae]|uniref:Alanine racemase n=1 Tax=Larsenimonas suaedae TaxID=1851019 RepID=A0ABU1GWK9_9GAMM|nr:alanine racemase [Larsenimonas suaedae]MCM2972997.1 alanine racemase [Larsenimonas suaedae]MDR5896434.1 alanine racemase [Larsenimonas suaedae]
MARPLTAYIDLAALRHNYQLACACAPESQTLAVMKADAYGHGALECARALSDLAPAFAVASIEEADRLRNGGITQPIALLEGFFNASELPRIAERNYWCVVHSQWQIEALANASLVRPITVWVKLDSGMHRLGFSLDEVEPTWHALGVMENVHQRHLMTHFASADLERSPQFVEQLEKARTVARRLDAPVSFANSPATLVHSEAHGAWNRPGIMLYGADPLERATKLSQQLKPVMTLETEVIALRTLGPGEPVGYGGRFKTARPSRIAVIACGYGDGYDRHAPDGTPVLVDGQRAPLAGRVSMDMMTVDVTDLPEVSVGARVTLWGNAATGEALHVDDVARHCETISYTLLTGVLPRVPRRYLTT